MVDWLCVKEVRWLLDSHLYKEVRKFVKDVFMETNIELVFQC
eukprot:Gb_40552 [translate_table: standard]